MCLAGQMQWRPTHGGDSIDGPFATSAQSGEALNKTSYTSRHLQGEAPWDSSDLLGQDDQIHFGRNIP
jgi:hypothetical protein